MAIKFAKGTDAMDAADAARGSGGNRTFTPFIKVAAEEKKYIQFLTPLDEIPGALIHQYVIVEYNSNGDAQYANFISPRDKSLQGPSGDDPIQDRFGLNPTYRLFAVAVELEPILKTVGGKKVISEFVPATRTWTDKDGEEHESIVAGVVVQAKANFFGHLQSWAEETEEDITSKIWSVSRDGNTKQPTYTFIPNAKHEALDLDDYEDQIPDLTEFLEGIADVERLHDMIDPLEDDFKITKFPQKKKPEGKTSSSKSSKANTRTKAKAEPVEEDEEEFETTTEKAAKKERQVGRLRQRIKDSDTAEAEGNDTEDED